jgi:polyisoprenoid-binding protein YceI
MKKLIFLLAFLCSFAQTFGQTINFDTKAAKVSFLFTAKNVEGSLSGFKASITLDANHPETASMEGSVETKTMETGIEARNHHLISADFFDAEKYPSLSFKSTKIESVDGSLLITGNLTIKSTVKEEHFVGKIENGKIVLTSTIYSGDYGVMKKEKKEDSQVDITIEIPIL